MRASTSLALIMFGSWVLKGHHAASCSCPLAVLVLDQRANLTRERPHLRSKHELQSRWEAPGTQSPDGVALRISDEDGAPSPGLTDERGSMLLAVRVPQDHVEPRTERCGQRSRRGAQSEPLCCSHSRSLSCRCASGPIRAQRFALGERRRQMGAVPWRAVEPVALRTLNPKATPDRGPSRQRRGTAGLELSLANCTVARARQQRPARAGATTAGRRAGASRARDGTAAGARATADRAQWRTCGKEPWLASPAR